MTEERTSSVDDIIEDKKLTPEIEAELQELRGFTSDDYFYWTPDVYRDNLPKNQWPIFKLKGRDGISIAKSEDDAGYYKTKTDQMYMTTGSMRIDLLRNNVLGWKNFKDKKGQEIKCERTVNGLTNATLKKISLKMQLQLQEAILSHSQLTTEEVTGLEF